MGTLGPISLETLSDLIGRIYDCAVEPARWQATLCAIRTTLGFRNAAMNVMLLPSGQPLLNIISGVEERWLDRMLVAGPEVVEQWGGAEKIQSFPLDEPAVLSRDSPRSNWEGNAYYLEWAKPQGITDVMAIGLSRDAETMGSIGFGRHQSAGEIGPRELDAARLLIPHLQRAVAIGRLLELKSIAAETHRSALDTLSVGVVLVAEDMEIVHANQSAQAMLAKSDPIHARSGRLGLHSPTATSALAAAIRIACENEASIGRRGSGIPAARLDGGPAVLHVLPLRAGSVRPDLSPRAAAAVLVASSTLVSMPSGEVLAVLLDLTAAEARIFSAIALGRSPSEIAAESGNAVSTVKTHLLRIFAKTGASRQADIVRLAASLSLPV